MKATFWATCLITTALACPVNAQVLEMPESEGPAPDAGAYEEQAPEPVAVEPASETGTFTVTVPGRGMTKDQVEARFGTPPEKVGAIGEPPISRWVYSGFTVYFEYDHVIHAVNHH